MTGTAFALLGPTASGKSKLAMALAERLPLEIVCMDSALVYRGMDIGTAKPSAEERSRVPHHVIDLVDPDAGYSTGRWREQAIRAVADVLARGKRPLLVGGTMLYYRALSQGLDVLPQADPEVRRQIDAQGARLGWPALHAELEKVDPKSARRIAPKDTQRIQRALEVWQLTGRPLSSLQGASKANLPFRLRSFALIPAERAALHRAIEERFEGMLRAGFLEEVASLRVRYRLNARMTSMRCVGYRQALEHLEGRTDRATMRERAIAATRQLAKRQLTWLRAFGEVLVLPPEQAHERLLRAIG